YTVLAAVLLLTTTHTLFTDASPLLSSRPPPHLHSFPTRRSSDLLDLLEALLHALAGGGVGRHLSGERRGLARPLEAGASCRLPRSEEHTSELQSPYDLVCRLLLEKKNRNDDICDVAIGALGSYVV